MKIKRDVGNLLKVWKQIFSDWKYLILAVFIGLVFYSINVLIANFYLVIYFFNKNGFFETIKFVSSLFFGFKGTVLLSSFVSLITISILLGLLFSLITYKTIIIKNASGKIGFLGTTGIFLGILAPGCVACGMGLISILGISAAFLTFLPFKGLEISILAIGILIFSIFRISINMKKSIICNINITDKGSERRLRIYGRRKNN